MKTNWNHVEGNRIVHGPLRTNRGELYGWFLFRGKRGGEQIEVCADIGKLNDWEHVSVKGRKVDGKKTTTILPGWEAMCAVKNLFWEPHETVVQYHPAESEYVNDHPHVLHLWRPKLAQIPTPPKHLV